MTWTTLGRTRRLSPAFRGRRREQSRPGASAPALELGTRVVLHGMTSMSEQPAHIVSLPTAEQARVGVVLKSGKSILVKPESLKASLVPGDLHLSGAT